SDHTSLCRAFVTCASRNPHQVGHRMNYKLTTAFGRVAAFAVLALLGAAPFAGRAQTPAASATASTAKEEPIKLEAFVSTGTRFNDRTVTESPVPIDVITREELNTGGYTETAQVLQTLVPSFNFPRPSL